MLVHPLQDNSCFSGTGRSCHRRSLKALPRGEACPLTRKMVSKSTVAYPLQFLNPYSSLSFTVTYPITVAYPLELLISQFLIPYSSPGEHFRNPEVRSETSLDDRAGRVCGRGAVRFAFGSRCGEEPPTVWGLRWCNNAL